MANFGRRQVMPTYTSSHAAWEKYWESEEHQPVVIHKELLEHIESFFNDLNDKKILEVGGGMAGDSIELAKKGANMTVVDFSQKALDLVKKEAKKAKVSIKIRNEDAEKLSFPNNYFDCVFHQGLL